MVWGVFWLLILDRDVRTRFNSPFESVPAHLYSRPYEISIGDRLKIESLVAALKKRSYKKVKQIDAPGEYAIGNKAVDIFTFKGLPWKHPAEQQAVRVALGGGRVRTITNHVNRDSLTRLQLAPELLGSLDTGPQKDRLILKIHDTPEILLDALITMEDRRFMNHWGVDPLGILRALFNNLRGRPAQGASTLTQQLVKNIYLDPSRTLKRKIKEALMALMVEFHYSKSEILERYLNEVYLGQSGNRAIHGFRLAATFYFSRPLDDLEPGELATLVGLIPAPSAYNPIRHPARAKKRRDLVLTKLAQSGFISVAENTVYRQQEMRTKQSKVTTKPRYHDFIDLVNRQLSAAFSTGYFKTEGHALYTTLDPHVQQTMEETLATKLVELEKQHDLKADTLQAAMMILEPSSGEVVAMLGSRNPRAAGFNRALDARRPIGSLVKPAVYLTALEQPGYYSLATPLPDTPVEIEIAGQEPWAPTNYDGESHDGVTLYSALSHSYNVPTVHLGMDLGLETVVSTLRRLGVVEPMQPYPSLLLGASNLSLIEMAQMYQTIANRGVQQPVRALRDITNQDGDVIVRYATEGERVVDENINTILNFALEGVAENGTAQALKTLVPGVKLAGKTGTTDDYRDSWFAGYGNNYVAVVWLGNDDNKPIKLSGSAGALRVWAAVMKAIDVQSLDASRVPKSVVWVETDLSNGQLAVAGCSVETAQRPFISGYEPRSNTDCQQVQDVVGGWLRKWFSPKDKTVRPKQGPQAKRKQNIDPFYWEADRDR